MEIKEIATIHTDFPEKFGIPRQSGLIPSLRGIITFRPAYRSADAVRGLEEYSHLWLLWGFSKAVRQDFSATVAPPRLGGRVRVGVFASRSPYRPNPIGLSSVRLDEIRFDEAKGPILLVSGIDMLDGTPIYDIKPYLPHVDAHPDASGGFAARTKDYALEVVFPSELLQQIRPEDQAPILEILRQDPRSRFICDPSRIWGVAYKNYNIRFQVNDPVLTVCQVEVFRTR